MVYLTARSMTDNHRKLHVTERSIDWYQLPISQTEHLLLVYEVSFPATMLPFLRVLWDFLQ